MQSGSGVAIIRHRTRGFSLVELSIVLVILGLLVGGVLSGQSLIRAAELRSVSSEYQRYYAAVQTFRDKYFALPGDMANATAFWGQATNCTPGTGGGALTGGTCNGHTTNGVIGEISNIFELRERFYAWDHLARAGLVEGTFTGLSGVGHVYDDAIAGINVPRAKLGSNVGWCIGAGSYSMPFRFNVDYNNSIEFGSTADPVAAYCSSGGSGNGGMPLLPDEAWNIDVKLDDGMPARGKVLASQVTRCTDAWTDVNNFNAVYSLSGSFSQLRECGLYFRYLQ